ncbi:hypothetical protein AB1Y20_022486 [Prymnesium parvum]|uniref:Sodium/hydrogen exchanger n=1 Tax=Prymnesium parvum TaxID=97485 RepID=A0AB34JGF0_PRYPA
MHAAVFALLLPNALAFRTASFRGVGTALRPELCLLKRCALPQFSEASPKLTADETSPPVTSVPSAPLAAGAHGDVTIPGWLAKLSHLEELGFGSVTLLSATALSLSLANFGPTRTAWLAFWQLPLGPAIGGHVLSVKGWVNEGLMAVFFFLVGLEIKQELRLGSLASIRKAVLPCIAAFGGMVTPMLVYLAVQSMSACGSLAAMTVPMATDIAFAMAIFGFFRTRMPAASSAFLLTLATVDDLGAIIVLAVCFSAHVVPSFLAASAAVTGGLTLFGRQRTSNLPLFAIGGALLWFCLLSAGVNADIAGVITGLTVSTQAACDNREGVRESFAERMIAWLSPLSCFFIMPVFALANTAVSLSGGVAQASFAPAAGIGAGLLLGKPLGIFCFTVLACKLGVASLPSGMTKRHVGIAGILGGIGFTMCLLLTEVSLPVSLQTLPKLAVLVSSGIAAVVGAICMRMLPELNSKAAAA